MIFQFTQNYSIFSDLFQPVILRPQNLRCNVVWGAAESRGGVTRSDSLLAHAIVCQLDVTLVVQQHVVQLQVPVDDPTLVQVVQGQADLRAVEPGENQKVEKKYLRFS